MNHPIKLVATGIIALMAIVIFMMTYFTVDQNELTVVTRFGQLTYVADPGLHFKMPFVNSTYDYRTDIQDLQPKDSVNTYTIDNQEVDIRYTLFYRIPPKQVEYIFTNNRDYRERMASMTTDRLKAAMGQVNVQSVAEKRGEIRDSIKATLTRDARPLGIEVTDFQLTDLQYTKDFRAAVSAAAVQKANIETVEYQRQQAEKFALTAKIKAEGEANAKRAEAAGLADARLLQATAEAKAIEIQGEATAKAIKAQSDALAANARLVEYKKAERWDGALPRSMLSNVVPFMSVNQAFAQEK